MPSTTTSSPETSFFARFVSLTGIPVASPNAVPTARSCSSPLASDVTSAFSSESFTSSSRP